MVSKSGARSSKPAKPAKRAAPKPQADPPAEPAATDDTEPTVHRAGGWMDRGDGRGWEIEE